MTIWTINAHPRNTSAVQMLAHTAEDSATTTFTAKMAANHNVPCQNVAAKPISPRMKRPKVSITGGGSAMPEPGS